MHIQLLSDELSGFNAFDATESAHLAMTAAFVNEYRQTAWQRSNNVGHITASALIVDSSLGHALLLYHRKLARWLQPGGHIDDTDESPSLGALRECREETGLTDLRLLSASLFDIDVHRIPERIDDSVCEPQHLHYDLRYLVQTDLKHTIAISNESSAYRWVALGQLIEPGNDISISRMAAKFLWRKK